MVPIYYTKQEKQYYMCLKSFHDYEMLMDEHMIQYEKKIHTLPEKHKHILLQDYLEKCTYIRKQLQQNYILMRLLAFNSDRIIRCKNSFEPFQLPPTDKSMLERVQFIIRQMHREWSVEGTFERSCSYQPILGALHLIYPPDETPCFLPIGDTGTFKMSNYRSKIKILLPGSGLCRLMLEIASRGFTVIGLENDYHHIIAAKKILDTLKASLSYIIYPWIDNMCNLFSKNELLHSSNIPDNDAKTLIAKVQEPLSLHVGDLLTFRKLKPKSFDCIITSFYIHFERNIIDCIEKISTILVKNGYWINVGPLNYHYSNIENEFSLELTYDEIRNVIIHHNFVFLEENRELYTPFHNNEQSMRTNFYKSVFFLAKKI